MIATGRVPRIASSSSHVTETSWAALASATSRVDGVRVPWARAVRYVTKSNVRTVDIGSSASQPA